MDERHTRVKKLALAYQTGWEYMPGSQEAGSVITDIFLDMMEENRKRYERIWEKQELEFLSAAPVYQTKPGLLKCGLAVKATEEGNGKWLPRDSKAYMILESGSLLWFSTFSRLQLTTASLKYAVYGKGLCSWQVNDEENSALLFFPSGQELAHPVFRWRFSNLCNGLKQCRFKVAFPGGCDSMDGNPIGNWKITDNRYCYSLKWEDTPDGAALCGETSGFAGNLQDTEYEIVLEIPYEEIYHREKQGAEVSLERFGGGFSLIEPPVTLEAEICLTDDAAEDGKYVLPFGYSPDAASCCYLACDGILARGRGEITLQFTESFVREEKLPSERTKEYEKIYKKYPWLQQTEDVVEWKPQETVWEYFNGRFWCRLPESSRWNTGCMTEENEKKERCFRFRCPEDMTPCSIEGEEHFFIRLRAVEVKNAYAAYYRKYIPVLENIRFASEETVWMRCGQNIPDLIGQEKIYLGFDNIVTPDNRWYVEYQKGENEGSGNFSFAGKQIAGWGERFGKYAFWVELIPTELQDTLGFPMDAEGIRFTANYVEILQVPGFAETDTDTGTEEIDILQGTAFHVETKEMGVLDAISVAEAYYNRTGAPCQAGWKAAGKYFARFGRVLTQMDIENLFEERYPAFRILSCIFLQDSAELVVEALARSGFPEDEFDKGKLQEVQEWLEEETHRMGSLWLKNCHVKIKLLRKRE